MKNRRVENGDFNDSGTHRTNNLIMVAGAVALVIIIIVLCVLIWRMAHKEDPAEEATDASTEATYEAPEASSDLADDEPGEAEGQESSETDVAQSEEMTGSSEESSTVAESGQEDPESVTMQFEDVSETVTAKDVTNLRSKPDTTRDDTIVAQLQNGETVLRTGVNEDAGWSRVEYDGATLYAVSRLLTTDLTVKSDTDNNTVITAAGRTITFTPCDDTVSPKMEVNLRGEPSTSQGNDTVHHRLLYGENVRRTGYDTASGWSRVEYKGEVLYVVTSLIYVVEDPVEE